MAFRDWLFSRNIVFSRFILVATWLTASVFCWVTFCCTVGPSFTYPFIGWWTFVSPFWLLWIMLLWTLAHKFLHGLVFNSLSLYSGVEWLCHVSECLNILRNCWALLPSSCPVLHPHQWYTRVLILHILANACYYLTFWFQPSWRVWSAISLWFRFAFPRWLVMLSIFSHAYWPIVYLEKFLFISFPLKKKFIKVYLSQTDNICQGAKS